jgi:hypothetical protein
MGLSPSHPMAAHKKLSWMGSFAHEQLGTSAHFISDAAVTILSLKNLRLLCRNRWMIKTGRPLPIKIYQGDNAMVILIAGSSIFLGFGLGFAAMAHLDARHHRLQGEKEMEKCGYPPRRKVRQALPARLPASGA